MNNRSAENGAPASLPVVIMGVASALPLIAHAGTARANQRGRARWTALSWVSTWVRHGQRSP